MNPESRNMLTFISFFLLVLTVIAVAVVCCGCQVYIGYGEDMSKEPPPKNTPTQHKVLTPNHPSRIAYAIKQR